MPSLASAATSSIPQSWLREPLENLRFGVLSGTPNGSGNLTLTHGFAAAPTTLIVQATGDANGAQVETLAASATTSLIRVYALADGADVTSGAQSVHWIAIK